MTTLSKTHDHCPEQERQLFDGSFSGKLRELALGSSRWDTLAAIRRASLDSWTVSDSGDTVSMLTSSVHVRITPKSDSGTWITACTPHGEFSLGREHWISQQIHRRIERRMESYKLQLQTQAEHAYSQLCERVRNNQPHQWKKEATDGWLASRSAHVSRGHSCSLESGFAVEVFRDIFSGNIPMEAAVSDAIRYENQMASYRDSMSRLPGSSMGGVGGYVPPPLRPGPFRFDTLRVEVHHPKLSRMASVLEVTYKPLAQHSVDTAHRGRDHAVWRQAVESVEREEGR